MNAKLFALHFGVIRKWRNKHDHDCMFNRMSCALYVWYDLCSTLKLISTMIWSPHRPKSKCYTTRRRTLKKDELVIKIMLRVGEWLGGNYCNKSVFLLSYFSSFKIHSHAQQQTKEQLLAKNTIFWSLCRLVGRMDGWTGNGHTEVGNFFSDWWDFSFFLLMNCCYFAFVHLFVPVDRRGKKTLI